MLTYYIEYGSGESGNGSLNDPFHVDSTTDLNNILSGSYSGATAAQAGDKYIFLNGAYGDLGLNTGSPVAGITFEAESYLGVSVTIADGADNKTWIGNAAFTVDGFDIISNHDRNLNFNSTATLRKCQFSHNVTNTYWPLGNDNRLTFEKCVLNIDTSYSAFLDSNGTVTFDKCAIGLKSSTTTNFVNTGGTVLATDTILYVISGTWNKGNGSWHANCANNWVYGWNTSPPTNVGTTDPNLRDPANGDFRPRPDFPLIGKGLV